MIAISKSLIVLIAILAVSPFCNCFSPQSCTAATSRSIARHSTAVTMVNGQDIATSADVTETIRQESLQQYDMVMDHFMFELGNDMVFLQDLKETSRYIDDNFDAILFDCDGVLYRGTDAIPDAAESLKSLLGQDKKVLFVTNNAGSNRKQLRDKLATILDCPDLTEEQMVSVGEPSKILAELLSQEHGLDPTRTLFVGDRLGTDVNGGIRSALVLTGCTTADMLVDLGVGTDEEPLPHIIFPHMGMMGLR